MEPPAADLAVDRGCDPGCWTGDEHPDFLAIGELCDAHRGAADDQRQDEAAPLFDARLCAAFGPLPAAAHADRRSGQLDRADAGERGGPADAQQQAAHRDDRADLANPGQRDALRRAEPIPGRDQPRRAARGRRAHQRARGRVDGGDTSFRGYAKRVDAQDDRRPDGHPRWRRVRGAGSPPWDHGPGTHRGGVGLQEPAGSLLVPGPGYELAPRAAGARGRLSTDRRAAVRCPARVRLLVPDHGRQQAGPRTDASVCRWAGRRNQDHQQVPARRPHRQLAHGSLEQGDRSRVELDRAALCL